MAFREWVAHEGLTTSGQLEQFRDTRIAIDAEDYLKQLLTARGTHEPLVPALGGLPFSLRKNVDDDLARFEEAGITPVFVFHGLEVACRDRVMVGREARKASNTLNEAWSIYDQGRGDDAVSAFGKACTFRIYHITRWLQLHLHEAGASVLAAPYDASAQMAYMDSNGVVDAIAGTASCLAFGADKVITKIDWDSKRVIWVDGKECQGKTLLNKDQFADLLLLSGCSLLPPLAEIEQEPSPLLRVQNTRSLLSAANQDGNAVCLQKGDEAYTAAFQKAKMFVKHRVVISVDGKLDFSNPEKMSKDGHEFIGPRLPDEIYYYLSRGVIGPRLLNVRTRHEIYEIPPLDGGNSAVYKELVQNKLRQTRVDAFATLSRHLHRYYGKLDIRLYCWFSETEERLLKVSEKMDLNEADNEKSWLVKEDIIIASEAEVAKSPLQAAFDLLADDTRARQTKSDPKAAAPGVLTKPKEVLLNTIFRSLQERGYINPDHTLSAWGKALKASLDRAKSNGYTEMALTTTEVEEAILLAFELLRLDVLNGKTMFPTVSGQPLRGTEADKTNTLLVSRIATLGLFKREEIGYTGPLSRNLLAYHQMAAAVRSCLRDLTEMHACSLLLSGSVEREREISAKQLTDLGANLPFTKEPDLGLALVVKSYLDELSNAADRRADVRMWFNHAVDLYGDLEKGWKMWDAVNAGIQAADSSIVNNETRKLFKNADDWLERKKASAPTVNGSA